VQGLDGDGLRGQFGPPARAHGADLSLLQLQGFQRHHVFAPVGTGADLLNHQRAALHRALLKTREACLAHRHIHRQARRERLWRLVVIDVRLLLHHHAANFEHLHLHGAPPE